MLLLIFCIILVAVDQLTKFIAVSNLKGIDSLELINNFFYLTYVENRGAAFGIMEGARWIFIAITMAVVVLAIVYLIKTSADQSRFMRAAVIMIVSGALGNAADRLFRGYVVDFLDFYIFGYNFPVFNFADILVVIGTMLFAFMIIFFDNGGKEKE